MGLDNLTHLDGRNFLFVDELKKAKFYHKITLLYDENKIRVDWQDAMKDDKLQPSIFDYDTFMNSLRQKGTDGSICLMLSNKQCEMLNKLNHNYFTELDIEARKFLMKVVTRYPMFYRWSERDMLNNLRTFYLKKG